MNIAQLEADLRAKTTALDALLKKTGEACEDAVLAPATATTPEVRGRRLMTAEEKQALQTLAGECEALKAKLDAARGDETLRARINSMTGLTLASPASVARAAAGAIDRRSLGERFVADAGYRGFIERGGHRVTGNWTSPAVEIVGATLTEDPTSGGALVVPDTRTAVVPLGYPRLVVADLIAPGTTDSNVVQYMREKTFTNAAAPVAEGGTKPESTLVFEAATAPVRKIAHWIPVSEEMLEDSAQTRSIIDARLRLGLSLAEEDQLLNGDGIAPNLLGFNNAPGLAPAVPRGTDTNIDAIFKQITAIATTAFIMPDGITMNPANWGTVQLTKNSQGNYLGSGPWASPQAPMLWGLPVAVTPAEPAGEALVGAYRSMSQIFRKGGVRVEASNSHANFFVQNLVAIRAEERLALAIYRTGAFGQVTGLN